MLIADSGEYSCLSTHSIETVVTLSHSSDEPRDSHVPHPAAHPSRLLVYLSDADLDARVILGADDSAAGRALPGYVGIHDLSALVLHLSLPRPVGSLSLFLRVFLHRYNIYASSLSLSRVQKGSHADLAHAHSSNADIFFFFFLTSE